VVDLKAGGLGRLGPELLGLTSVSVRVGDKPLARTDSTLAS
jgi:hypothetical protein